MRYKRKKECVHKFEIRTRFTEGHHLTNSTNGGQSTLSNMLLIEVYRHSAWHHLFGNRSLNRVIDYLKSRNSITDLYRKEYSENAVFLLFGVMTLDEIIICLMRLRALKTFQVYKLRLN